MTTFKEQATATQAGKMSLAQILEVLAEGQLPLRFTAYDGSCAGPD
ncbi:MAG: SAM-dependent methyltransferase, partial [Mycobacteriaceae bacterium]|nr:SAM-dependent methyltransferase [Mycobacteriaceae bacterium]